MKFEKGERPSIARNKEVFYHTGGCASASGGAALDNTAKGRDRQPGTKRSQETRGGGGGMAMLRAQTKGCVILNQAPTTGRPDAIAGHKLASGRQSVTKCQGAMLDLQVPHLMRSNWCNYSVHVCCVYRWCHWLIE